MVPSPLVSAMVYPGSGAAMVRFFKIVGIALLSVVLLTVVGAVG